MKSVFAQAEKMAEEEDEDKNSIVLSDFEEEQDGDSNVSSFKSEDLSEVAE